MKTGLKGGVIGGIIGVLIFLYDYDFLLNAGGPSTPISDSIRIFFGNLFGLSVNTQGLSVMPFSPIFSLFVLVVSLLIVGGIIGLFVGKIKGKKWNPFLCLR